MKIKCISSLVELIQQKIVEEVNKEGAAKVDTNRPGLLFEIPITIDDKAYFLAYYKGQNPANVGREFCSQFADGIETDICVQGIVKEIEKKLDDANASTEAKVEDGQKEETTEAAAPTTTGSASEPAPEAPPATHAQSEEDPLRELKVFLGDALRSLDMGLIEDGEDLDDNTLAALGVGAISLVVALGLMVMGGSGGGSKDKGRKKR